MYNNQFNNQFFNPQYVNPIYYQQIEQQIAQYQFEQTKEVINVMKAVKELCIPLILPQLHGVIATPCR